MTLSTVLGLIFIPVTFAVVEYLSHRFVRGGKRHHDGLDLRSRELHRANRGRQLARSPAQKEARHERTYRDLRDLSIVAVAFGLLAGCNVGPKYVRPNVHSAAGLSRRGQCCRLEPTAKDSLGDEQWAAVYREPELQELIRKALANNYDVRIAAQTNPRAAGPGQDHALAAVSNRHVGGTGIGATLPSSLGTQIPSPLVDGSFNLSAAWTPDFWGLYRKQTEAARAQLLAQVWAQRAVQMTLVQQVATAYLQIRALDAQLEITKETHQGPAGFCRSDEDSGERRFGSAIRRAPGGTTALHGDFGDASTRSSRFSSRKMRLLSARRKSRPHRTCGSKCACTSAAGSSHRLAFATA